MVLMNITKQLIIFHEKDRSRSFIFFNSSTEKCGIDRIELMCFSEFYVMDFSLDK